MYTQHFHLNKHPFSLTPNTEFYCNLSDYQSALNVLLTCLETGEGFIKITGEVGAGKTMLCRLLLDRLASDQYVTVFIHNPDLSAYELRKSLASELGVVYEPTTESTGLTRLIHEKMEEVFNKGKQVVFVIDEAQCMPDETLEALRLLTNLETKSNRLLQIVLFGQPELDEKINQYKFRHLKQRIAFAYTLKPLTKPELDAYVFHRLAVAGHTQGRLFTKKAMKMLYRYSGGIPRLVNIFCHKSLLVAYGKGLHAVDGKSMKRAIVDTPSQTRSKGMQSRRIGVFEIAILVLLIVGFVVDYAIGLVHF